MNKKLTFSQSFIADSISFRNMLNILKNYEATENVDADTSSEKLDLATNHTLVLNEFLQQVDEVVAAENS